MTKFQFKIRTRVIISSRTPILRDPQFSIWIGIFLFSIGIGIFLKTTFQTYVLNLISIVIFSHRSWLAYFFFIAFGSARRVHQTGNSRFGSRRGRKLSKPSMQQVFFSLQRRQKSKFLQHFHTKSLTAMFYNTPHTFLAGTWAVCYVWCQWWREN